MSIAKAQELKRLQTRLIKLRSKLKAARKDKNEACQEVNKLEAGERNLNKQISDLQKDDSLTVSEHCIVRFMERAMGSDVKAVQGMILEDLAGACECLGNGDYPIREKLIAVVRNNVVVTVHNMN